MTSAGVRVSIRELPLPDVSEDVWDPTTSLHCAVMSDGDIELGSVTVKVRPRDSVGFWTALRMDDGDAGWLVEMDRVDLRRDYVGHRYGLSLVAEAIAHFSRGRTCLITVVAEPRNWESLKERDRRPALVALDRHWSRLGFDGGEVRSDDVRPRRMRMVARDYEPPPILVLPTTW